MNGAEVLLVEKVGDIDPRWCTFRAGESFHDVIDDNTSSSRTLSSNALIFCIFRLNRRLSGQVYRLLDKAGPLTPTLHRSVQMSVGVLENAFVHSDHT